VLVELLEDCSTDMRQQQQSSVAAYIECLWNSIHSHRCRSEPPTTTFSDEMKADTLRCVCA